MRSVGGDYKDRFTTRAEDVAEMVNLDAIGPAVSRHSGHIQQHPSVAQSPVVPDRISQPCGSILITISEVKGLLVRRECNAIRSSEIVEKQCEFATRR